jgi:hypothetical protein
MSDTKKDKKEIKYRLHNKCPRRLPKVHTSKRWLELLADPSALAFVEGVVIVAGELCVLKHAGRGRVLALPLTLLPDPAFTGGLAEECLARIETYRQDLAAGKYAEALEDSRDSWTPSGSSNFSF